MGLFGVFVYIKYYYCFTFCLFCPLEFLLLIKCSLKGLFCYCQSQQYLLHLFNQILTQCFLNLIFTMISSLCSKFDVLYSLTFAQVTTSVQSSSEVYFWKGKNQFLVIKYSQTGNWGCYCTYEAQLLEYCLCFHVGVFW